MDSDNPFAAPAESAPLFDPTSITRDATALPIATAGKRLSNYILDWIFMQIFSFFCGVFLALAGMEEVLDGAGGLLFGVLVAVIYYGGQEMFSGRTLGKLITGTMVVNEFGEHPTPGQILGRTFARLIPFEIFSFLGGKGKPVGWHDSLSGTRVITIR